MQDSITTLSQLYLNHQYEEAGIRIKKLWAACNGNPSNELRAAAMYHMSVMNDFAARDNLNEKAVTSK